VIVLNQDSTQLDSARFSGLHFKAGVSNLGYFTVNSTGKGFRMKGPENDFILTIPDIIDDSQILINKGNQTISGSLDLDNNLITNVLYPINNQDVATKQYVDDNVFVLPPNTIPGPYTKVVVNDYGIVISGSTLLESDIPIITTNIISDFDSKIREYKISDFTPSTESLDMNNQIITNLSDPINDNDAVTKSYVDNRIVSIEDL
jgi:hypothetical protein